MQWPFGNGIDAPEWTSSSFDALNGFFYHGLHGFFGLHGWRGMAVAGEVHE